MDTNEWIKRRAYQLWEIAGKPCGHDLDFWLQAEREYACHHICILSPGACEHQQVNPSNGGRHVSICTHDKECGNRASDYFEKGKYGPY